MSLLSLPNELLLSISTHLPTATLSHFTRTNHRLHSLLHRALTRRLRTDNLATAALHFGISANHLPTIHLALSHGATNHLPHARPNCSAVSCAASLGHYETVELLIGAFGAAIVCGQGQEEEEDCHLSPLYYAITRNDVRLAEMLLSHGARVTWRDEDGGWGWGWGWERSLVNTVRYCGVEMEEVLMRFGQEWRGRGGR